MKRGFTLIELLVVIAIIIGFLTFFGFKAKEQRQKQEEYRVLETKQEFGEWN